MSTKEVKYHGKKRHGGASGNKKHKNTGSSARVILIACAALLAALLILAIVLIVRGLRKTQEEPAAAAEAAETDEAEDGQEPEPLNCEAHVDTDDNGFCDVCGTDVTISIDIFAVNDLHGKFADSSSQPGVDELTTYLETQGTNTILLSSGDMWQGSSESVLTDGRIITDWMNEEGFVSMTLGNHEFDWGTDFIEENLETAQFPFLAINIYDAETGEPAEFCHPSVIVERDGVKIGIIGAIGDCYSSISADQSTGFYFKVGAELTLLVKAEAERLRGEGAEIIIYAVHDGYGQNCSGITEVDGSQIGSYYDISLSDGPVDIVFEAHTHRSYVLKDSYGVYHLQGGGENKGISHAELVYNTVNGTCSTVTAEIVESSVYSTQEADPVVEELLEAYSDEISQANVIYGYNEEVRDADFLKQLVADLYYQAGLERWGEEYPIALAGGYITIRSPYSLGIGDVTYSALQALFPFDDQLVLCSISGKHLRSRFLDSGNKNYFVSCGDSGSLGESIDEDAVYYIVTDTYSSSYEPNHCTEIERYDDGIYARDLLAAYFAGTDAVPAPEEPEYELTDIAELLRIGAELEPGARSEESYYVKATVESVENGKYGNMYLIDENGDRIYVYGIHDATGNVRYDSMEDPPKAGDTAVFFGTVQRYVSDSGQETIVLYQALVMPE